MNVCRGFGKTIAYRLPTGRSGERRLATIGAHFKRARDTKTALQESFSDEIRENKSALECVESWTSNAAGTEAAAATQWDFVFTLMTLELGLVPLPLYARNR